MFAAYYRQLRLPSETGLTNSRRSDAQLSRLKCFLGQVKWATSISPNIICTGDKNIDLSEHNDVNQCYGVGDLLKEYLDFLNSDCFYVVNKEFTRHQSNSRPSLTDHLLTNVPNNINNVVTAKNHISDYSTITINLHTKLKGNKKKDAQNELAVHKH